MAEESFESLGIDTRLLRALNKRQFVRPTPVQSSCIPKALEGHDIVARARTGSGKTMAYLIPGFQRVLQVDKGKVGWQALVLVPTRELAEQTLEEAKFLAQAFKSSISVSLLTGEGRILRQTATTAGQIVVSTPGRVAELIRAKVITSQMLNANLCFLALDEADLLFSYGYEEDMGVIAPCIPRSCQCMLTSATTSEEVERLTRLLFQNPVVLDLLPVSEDINSIDQDKNSGGDIDHRLVQLPDSCGPPGSMAETTERLLRLLTILKYGLAQKKVILFVNSPDSGMRLRLFLDAFGIKCCELHSEMPLNTRNHVLQQFNKGIFDYLIATDDFHGHVEGPKHNKNKRSHKNMLAAGKKDVESGVTRGIDFKGVRTVINAEMPDSVNGYIHRVGRTGRAGSSGTAISLTRREDDDLIGQVNGVIMSEGEGGVKAFDRITKVAVESLRYRGEDVAKSITKSVIREARAKDLRAELLNSKRLASFFEERPADLQLLRHDRSVAASSAGAAAPHLKHIPSYLRDPSLQGKSFVGSSDLSNNGFLPFKKRRKTERADPVKGFAKAPNKGADHLEEPTEMELRAEAAAKKERKRLEMSGKYPGGTKFVPKRNVRKKKGRKR
eukprot:jgi/Picsp_1/4557/NSC_01927-R1_dead-box atp-dependent rna helicase 16-like